MAAVAFGGASTSTQQLGPEIDHDGQIVAVVLADTFEAARDAARRVRVTYAAATPSATSFSTASGWRAGLLLAGSRRMSSIRQALRCHASASGRRRIVWMRRC